ncbi:MAG: hypothetical protein ACLFV8_01340 [Alphaproteobacteria bacterium]
MKNFYETPRPFEGSHRNDPMIDSILHGASVEIRPVEGLPGEEGAALSRAISQAAHEHDIAAVTDEGAEIADRLTGTAEIATGFSAENLPARLFLIGHRERHLGLPGTGRRIPAPAPHTEVRFSWKLTDTGGTVKDTMEFTRLVPGALPRFDERERKEIAARTVGWLRASLDRQAASPAQAEARRSKPIILVSPVEGAPGDGRVSLTKALSELLTATGACEVLAASEQASIPEGRNAYRVTGRVEVSDGGPETQIVSIAWTLSDLAGTEIGTVSQQNATPRGSLDGAWGDIAYAAAMGARDGLLALMARTAAPASVE